MEVPLGAPDSLLSGIVHSSKPILVRDTAEVRDERARKYFEAPHTEAFLAVPLLTQGKAVGLLAVDNAVTGRPISEGIQDLLFTIGAQVAGAVDRARLYQTLERRVEERTAELAAATLRAEEGAAAIARADREKEVLLEETQESERRLTDIIEFLPDATLVIDAEGHVIAWNRAMEDMTGVKAEDMVGKGDYEYAVPFYGERRPILVDLVVLPLEELERRYAHIERRGSVLSGETYTPALKGGARFLYATASALHNGRGQVVGAIETIRDITERKLAEVELQKAKSAAEAATQVDWAAYLTKPIKQSQLFNVVSGIFGRADERPARPAPQPQKADEEMAARCPLEVLLAEDNTFNQKLALHLLGQLGYRADLATNGLEAVQSVERRRYDVILMDVQMPEMDGLDASRLIDENTRRALSETFRVEDCGPVDLKGKNRVVKVYRVPVDQEANQKK